MAYLSHNNRSCIAFNLNINHIIYPKSLSIITHLLPYSGSASYDMLRSIQSTHHFAAVLRDQVSCHRMLMVELQRETKRCCLYMPGGPATDILHCACLTVYKKQSDSQGSIIKSSLSHLAAYIKCQL